MAFPWLTHRHDCILNCHTVVLQNVKIEIYFRIYTCTALSTVNISASWTTFFGVVSVAQLVASVSASTGTVELLYLSVFIFCVDLHQFLILCSPKALLFVKLYFRTTDNYLNSLVSLTGSLMLSHAN